MRAQVYLDVSMSSGGGGRNPDGTPTPLVDFDYYFAALNSGYGKASLVLDPYPEQRWAVQSALCDAFGWDGKKSAEARHIERLRDIAASMTYLPPWMVHKAVVLGNHDRCPMPHGED